MKFHRLNRSLSKPANVRSAGRYEGRLYSFDNRNFFISKFALTKLVPLSVQMLRGEPSLEMNLLNTIKNESVEISKATFK